MSGNAWVVTPLLVPLAVALVAGLLAEQPRWQARLSLGGALALLACSLVLLAQVQAAGTARMAFGDWEAPFGIEFVADRLGASMAVITALMGVAALLFQASDADPATASPTLHPLVHLLLAGVGGAFVTADLFNLYVWFELMLIAALGLLAHGARPRHLDATLKYFVLNTLGTLLLLVSIAAVYGATGHLNFGALERAGLQDDAARLTPFVVALVLAFLVKAGAFPVFAWLPASYHTLPAPLAALFAALLTKVGVYAVLRVLGDVFGQTPAVVYEALGWIAVATMVTGVLGAAYHWDMRRILAFHIISQIGYMLLGIALASQQGHVGTVFYIIHHIIVKANLFLIAAIVYRLTGSYDLRRCGGLYALRPWLGMLFLVPALSLVGIPPLSGFWAKFIVVREALVQGQAMWAAAALLVGFLTLYSMMKIWIEAFWKRHPDSAWTLPAGTRLAPAYAATLMLAALTVAIGLAPEPLVVFAQQAAAQMLQGPR
jgi:multicomponent Na+:H+ antiporter subunit D